MKSFATCNITKVRNPQGFRTSFLWGALFLYVLHGTLPVQQYVVTLLEPSELYLEGNTNVTPFTCLASRINLPLRLEVTPVNAPDHTYPLKATFRIPVYELDCGKSAINQDMQEALNADAFPYIEMRPLEASLLDASTALNSGSWVPLRVKVQMTVAGQCKNQLLDLKARQLCSGEYRLVGSFPLKMTAFGVDPPSVLMGLIQVEDQINIHFDLRVRCLLQ